MTLPEVFAALDRAIGGAGAEDLPALAGALEEARVRIQLRLARTCQGNGHAPTPHPDGNLSVDEAALRLGVSGSYIYKHARKLPFTIRIGRRVVCSARGVERWNKQRAAAGTVRFDGNTL